MLYNDKERRNILAYAVADVKIWCHPLKDLIGENRISDQYWLEAFNKNNIHSLTADNVRNFFIRYSLQRVTWNYEIVASLLKDFVNTNPFNPAKDITNFADKLGEATLKRSTHPSAASKIANFAFPNSEVYIWR